MSSRRTASTRTARQRSGRDDTPYARVDEQSKKADFKAEDCILAGELHSC